MRFGARDRFGAQFGAQFSAHMRWLSSGVGFAALAGCASDPEPGVFVGAIEGSDSVVGVVTDGEAGLAYLCGGSMSMYTHHAWVPLSFGRDGALAGEGGGAEISLEPDEADGYSGRVIDPDGVELTVDLARGAAPEGPYEAEVDSDCPAGAVVFERDGRLLLQGVVCVAAIPAQVVPVGQITSDGAGIRVRADLAADPPLEFQVSPASP